MNLHRLFNVISLSVVVAGCQSLDTANNTGTQQAKPSSVSTAQFRSPADKAAAARYGGNVAAESDTWERVREQLSFHTIENPAVTSAQAHYAKQANYFPAISERAEPYLYYVVEEVEKRGMPIEIALLPIVESTYTATARSSQDAAGLWQIMPTTGDYLGLEQNWWYDGRRDVRQSTKAALDYLEQLHNDLDQDWLLAIAAYNSGVGRVQRAIAANESKGLPTDFWSLNLPKETRKYIPKLVAISSMIADPDSFGVKIPPIANEPAFDVVQTGGQIELARAADLVGLDLMDLRTLNPGQLRWATAPNQTQEILVPAGFGTELSDAVSSLTPDDRVQWEHYEIQPGDSLIGIARHFDTDVGMLQDVNRIDGSKIRAGGTLLIPSSNDWSNTSSFANSQNSGRTAKDYRVRRGDSLYLIAGKFDVSVDDIISWNALSPNAFLQPGQELTLYIHDS